MVAFASLLALVSSIAFVAASPVPAELEARQACNSYVIISTRGTGEAQGASAGFPGMISRTLSSVSGGTTYNTRYPAGIDQNSASGTADIIRYIRSGLSRCPSQRYVLLGYSQGAAATVDAFKQLSTTSTEGRAIVASVLIGNPQHRPGKRANVDQNGGSSTDNDIGISGYLVGAGIPSAWDSSDKVLDICWNGDGVCGGFLITAQHLLYGSDTGVQTLGANFIIDRLN